MKTHQLTPQLGVEMEDIDLHTAPWDVYESEILRLLDSYYLVLIRGQQLTVEDQIRLMTVFGQIVDERGDGERYGFITNTRSDNAGLPELPWHSDFSSTPYPHAGISLYCVELSGAVSGTRFVSAVERCDALPSKLRGRLEDLRVLNIARTSGDYYPPRRYAEVWERVTSGTFGAVATYRDAIGKHPRTSRPMLNICSMFSIGFEGLSYEDGQELLRETYEVLYDPKAVVDHSWEVGDIVIWDNVAVQHSRGAVPPSSELSGSQTRTMVRVSANNHFGDLTEYLPDLLENLNDDFKAPSGGMGR